MPARQAARAPRAAAGRRSEPPLLVGLAGLPAVRLEERAGGGILTSAAAAAVTVRSGESGAALGPEGERLGTASGLDLAAHLTHEEAKGDAGSVVSVPVVGGPLVRSVHLVGVGDGSPAAHRKAAAALARRARDAESLAVALGDGTGPGITPEHVRAFVESLLLGGYAFSLRSDAKPAKLTDVRVIVAGATRFGDALERGVRTARAVALARDLVNTPSLDKTPAWLAERAVEAAAEALVGVRVRDEHELRAEGFGGIVAVGMGSPRPPRLVELTYAPPGARRHVVLVGKGITFDSGGLSLKSNEGMLTMKTDMTGGAVVVAAVTAAAGLGLGVRVTGLVCAAENMPSGSAQRPGDVIRHYGGRTVEVLNTDAEGRLVMADALAYADAELDPDVVIDVATLTGAASLGLGKRHGALFTADDRLAADLLDAAEAGGERLWRMPLVDEYRRALDSSVADLRNVADAELHYSGGAIIAALFLREFVGGRRWAHLDIAGPARADKDEDDVGKGGTAFGVRTLIRYLEGLARRR